MRVAFVGKGGSGKSTIAGTIARLLARDGAKVLALDVDTLPGLAFSLGMGKIGDGGLPEGLAEKREGKGWVMREEISAEALVDEHALDAPDGVRFLQLGKLPGRVRPGSTTAFRHVVDSFRRPGWSLVGDLAAGPRQGSFGWAGFATVVVLITEPTAAGLLAVGRLRRALPARAGTVLGLVLNKVREARPPALEAAGLPVWAEVPYDEAVAAAEREGRAPLDVAPDGPGVMAMRELLSALRDADPGTIPA